MSVRPTGRGASVAALGAVAIAAAYAFGTEALLPLGAGLVALPALAMLLVGLGSLRITPASTAPPPGARAGDVVALTSDPKRGHGHVLSGLVVVRSDPRVASLGDVVERGTETTSVRLRRGVHQLAAPRLEVVDALGLARRDKVGSPGAAIVIPPRVIPMPFGVLASSARLGRERRQGGPGTDLDRIREYRAGDPLSRIHWAQTAKRGRLQTKVLTAPDADREAMVVALDVSAEAAADVVAFEESVSAAASIAHASIGAGTPVSLELRADASQRRMGATLRRDSVDRRLAEVRPGSGGDAGAGPPTTGGRLLVTARASSAASPGSGRAGDTTILIGPDAAHISRRREARARIIPAQTAEALAIRLSRRGARARAA